jgi:hypothetical protein
VRVRLQKRPMRFWLGWLLAAYTLSPSWSAAQVRHERIGVPLATFAGGERFPAVNIVEGQNVRVVLSNVLGPTAEAASMACPLIVRFFDTEGALVGSEQNAHLMPGASATVTASSQPGLVRATVSVAKFSDPKRACGVKASLEVFDMRTGGTVLLIPSDTCIGNGACGTPMAPP